MKVALIGATGKAGSRVLAELVQRGHAVTAIVRHPENVETSDKVAAHGVDGSKQALVDAIRGHDAVVSSVRFVDLDPDILVPAVQESGVKRYLVVGGAGSLLHPDGTQEVDQPGFPDVAKPNSNRGTDLLNLLKASSDLDWTFISPPRMFIPGERTGEFRYGKDHMLMKDDQPTSISFEDFAIALVDEMEKPERVRERFTVGY
ncbi:MAG: 3-beta hydroxysteroid dehydrogenase [Rhizobiaceae bacterium MnEN-MB40S]|nr:MAG: 3-beta hydroxysteroid dehydrogenase [Rhizobiaceae bacterium MnEN-MB40S]